MKKVLAIVLLLCMLLSSATAELYAPPLEDRLTEATLDDFVGYWDMVMCTSSKPVDMHSYYYVTVDAQGNVMVDHGSSSDEVWYETTVQQPEDGVLYIADANGENGAYYFLFDESLMGCAETMDNPDTIRYLECVQDEPWSEEAWREESSAEVLSEVGEVTPVMDVQDCIGTWNCWATTSSDMGQMILDPAFISMTMSVEEQKVTLSSRLAEETQVSEMPLELSEQGVSFYSEDEDTRYWLFLRSGDELVLMDDPEFPVAAMFFYTPERWEQEEASGAFMIGPELTEPVAVTELSQVAGQWEATHSRLLGYVEAMSSGTLSMEISEDGSVVTLEEFSDPWVQTASVQDGYLLVEDEDGYVSYFQLYENGVLAQSLDSDDFNMTVYFQRQLSE